MPGRLVEARAVAASRGSADDAQQREQGQQQQPGERGDGVAKGHRHRLRPESARVNGLLPPIRMPGDVTTVSPGAGSGIMPMP